MALISCPECEKEVSDKARSCPNCGFPFKEAYVQKVEITGIKIKNKPKKKVIAGIICLIAAILTMDFRLKNEIYKKLKSRD